MIIIKCLNIKDVDLKVMGFQTKHNLIETRKIGVKITDRILLKYFTQL